MDNSLPYCNLQLEAANNFTCETNSLDNSLVVDTYLHHTQSIMNQKFMSALSQEHLLTPAGILMNSHQLAEPVPPFYDFNYRQDPYEC